MQPIPAAPAGRGDGPARPKAPSPLEFARRLSGAAPPSLAGRIYYQPDAKAEGKGGPPVVPVLNLAKLRSGEESTPAALAPRKPPSSKPARSGTGRALTARVRPADTPHEAAAPQSARRAEASPERHVSRLPHSPPFTSHTICCIGCLTMWCTPTRPRGPSRLPRRVFPFPFVFGGQQGKCRLAPLAECGAPSSSSSLYLLFYAHMYP